MSLLFFEKVDVYNKNLGLGLRPPPQKIFTSKKTVRLHGERPKIL